MKKLTTIFIDKNSIFSIFKLLIFIFKKKYGIEKIYYFEKKNLFILKIISKIFKFQLFFFEYRNFYDFVDKDQMNLGWKIQTYQAQPFLKECLNSYKIQYEKLYTKGFEKFLIKTLAAYNWPNRNESLLEILIKLNEIENKTLNHKVFISENILFSEVFKKYSLNLGIDINFYNKISFYYLYSFMKNLLKFLIGKFNKKIKYKKTK